MVGVPTSRGCDACRKRKKRCDASETTSGDGCSWCRRINIPCVGAGQQRYSFKDESKKLKSRYQDTSALVKRAESLSAPSFKIEDFATSPFFHLLPSNELSTLTQAFVSRVSPSIDIKYQLVWNFGGFLQEIPRRLGVNPALDAAADVLVTCHTKYCAGIIGPDSETLVKHSNALHALKECLDDPVQARASETLCAVMVMSICQIFMGFRDGPRISHYVGASQILKNRGYVGPQDDFEALLLVTLRGPVVIEALFDNRIQFTGDEWESLVLSGLDNGTLDGDLIMCLAQLPSMMQRGREALHYPETCPVNVEGVIAAVQSLKHTYRPVLERLRERWRSWDTASLGCSKAPGIMRMTHCHCSRMVAFGLAVAVLINCVLRSLGCAESSLQEENDRMGHEMLELSDIANAYRPLGSLAMSLFLGTAWVGATDLTLKKQLGSRSIGFCQDVYGPGGGFAMEDMTRLAKEFTLS